MAGLFAKGRVVTLAFLHELVDKVVDMNSIPVLKQHIRDLEGAEDAMTDTVAGANASVTGLARELRSIESEMAQLNKEIDLYLGDDDDSNDHKALPREARLVDLEKKVAAKRGDKEVADQTALALSEALSNLKTKREGMVSALGRLEDMDRSAKAKENAAATLKQAAELAGTGDGVSVDNLASKIQRRSDVADEKFNLAMGAVKANTGQDIATLEAKKRLEERKARLKAQKVGATQSLS